VAHLRQSRPDSCLSFQIKGPQSDSSCSLSARKRRGCSQQPSLKTQRPKPSGFSKKLFRTPLGYKVGKWHWESDTGPRAPAGEMKSRNFPTSDFTETGKWDGRSEGSCMKSFQKSKKLSHHPRFFDEQFGSAVGAIAYVRGSGNCLMTSIPLYIRGIDFCDCLASTLGWVVGA